MFLAGWQIWGLPAHALVVHVAVVLIPIAALCMLVTGWRPVWRRRYAGVIAALAAIGAVAAFVAAQSGESLQHSIQQTARATGAQVRFGDHPEDGQLAEISAAVFAVLAASVFALERWRPRVSVPSWAPIAVYVVTAVSGLAALIGMVAAGHSGATLVWKDLGTFVHARS